MVGELFPADSNLVGCTFISMVKYMGSKFLGHAEDLRWCCRLVACRPVVPSAPSRASVAAPTCGAASSIASTTHGLDWYVGVLLNPLLLGGVYCCLDASWIQSVDLLAPPEAHRAFEARVPVLKTLLTCS